jgi:ADP-ribose pyrophosphatase YjhB (NUDIX family)
MRRIGIKLAALAQDGLTFAASDYDLDRYQQVSRLAAELLSVLSGRPADELAVELGRDSGYATPKIDVRGAIFDGRERVLLMREKIDGRWSLPGGWADPGDAPSAAVTREILEETGYHSSAVKLIACWDRDLRAIRRRCRFTCTSCSFSAAATEPCSRRRRWRPSTSAGSASAPCPRCPSAGSITASSSARWPTIVTLPCPPNSTNSHHNGHAQPARSAPGALPGGSAEAG